MADAQSKRHSVNEPGVLALHCFNCLWRGRPSGDTRIVIYAGQSWCMKDLEDFLE